MNDRKDLEQRVSNGVILDTADEAALSKLSAARVSKNKHNRERVQRNMNDRKVQQQEDQAPKARGKYKTFDDRMEDLKRYKETHDHANLPIREDKSLAQFCAKARHARIKSRQGQCEATDQRTHSGL